jgi:phosphoglycerate dehydrogenase-like enzyme
MKADSTTLGVRCPLAPSLWLLAATALLWSAALGACRSPQAAAEPSELSEPPAAGPAAPPASGGSAGGSSYAETARAVKVPAQAELPGSERGARAAIDPAELERLRAAGERLVFLAGSWSPAQLAEARALAPEVELISGLDRKSALAHAARAQGVEAQLLSSEFLAQASRLRWVQALSAGVEHTLAVPGLADRRELVLTNSKGVHGPVIAEHVFALLLAHVRRLEGHRRDQARGDWNEEEAGHHSLAGSTLLIAGLGGIGEQVALRAKAFDMRVLATVRTPRERPACVDRLETGERLDSLLPEADFLVICLPLTPETEGLFDARRLGLLPRGAFLVNIARGALVDTEALTEALRSGQLSGAGLDVTEPEPLPPGHPLWSLSGVILTPHVAGSAELTFERRWALQKENLRRFAHGEALLNVVDPAAGY